MDFDSVADDLYTLPPGEFTSTRDARVKEAKAEGDKDTAARIATLRRPTMVGWLANQLTRRLPDEVGPLLELGDALREATATLSGPELRELSRQRHQLVYALVQQAKALAADAGQRVTEDVSRGLEETLHAALADPAAEASLRAARLTDGLSHTGYAPSEADDASSPARPPSKTRQATGKPSAEDKRRADRQARLERDLEDAWAKAREAAQRRDEAARALSEERDAVKAAERRISDLRLDLERAETEHSRAKDKAARADQAHTRADREAAATRTRVTDLQRQLDQL